MPNSNSNRSSSNRSGSGSSSSSSDAQKLRQGDSNAASRMGQKGGQASHGGRSSNDD